MSTREHRADMHAVALIGNPNTGKSTLFNALTGARQKIANFPGVTVEAKLGLLRAENTEITVVDLPGTYSLAARSPDERIATEALMGRAPGVPKPDGVIVVADASSLDRNLYLATQVLEFGLPTVVALTMLDVAQGRGVQVDADALSKALGVPVVPVNAPRGQGVKELIETLHRALHHPGKALELSYPDEFRAGVGELHNLVCDLGVQLGYTPARPEALRLLVDGAGPFFDECEEVGGPEFLKRYEAIREKAAAGRGLSMLEAQTRYGAISAWLSQARKSEAEERRTVSDRVDAVLTHKLWGSLVFIALMLLVFQSIFTWAEPLMGAIEGGVGWLGGHVVGLIPEHMETLSSLVENGVFGGVAAVLVFLPQILILFLFIAILEDLGYMSRAAFLMDRLMAPLGLNGRSFIPLLSSFACAIPGIMGTRVIEDRNTRLTTIFLAPFMSCSARLPVYTLFIAAFVPAESIGWFNLQGLTLFAMYWVGVLFAIPTALILKRGILKSRVTPFLLELPGYKLPRVGNVGRVLWQRGGAFVKRAGTIIFAVAILVWAAAWFPRDAAVMERYEAMGELTAEQENQRAGELVERSLLGRIGHAIEPAVEPLGWDWRIGMAAVASFPAREVVIAAMGTIFNLGEVDEDDPAPLREVLQRAQRPDGTRLFTLATGLSVMVFFALCAQCAATLAIMRRETNSWRWPAASFLYMTTLAYLAALLTYQAATALGG
jgi:ferrous iron transport protein B